MSSLSISQRKRDLRSSRCSTRQWTLSPSTSLHWSNRMATVQKMEIVGYILLSLWSPVSHHRKWDSTLYQQVFSLGCRAVDSSLAHYSGSAEAFVKPSCDQSLGDWRVLAHVTIPDVAFTYPGTHFHKYKKAYIWLEGERIYWSTSQTRW